MPERRIVIVNKLGLHARAAAKLVKLAGGFAADIHLVREQRRVNAKSIMGVLMLAAAKGTELTVTACGEDEDAALDALEALIMRRFDEEQ